MYPKLSNEENNFVWRRDRGKGPAESYKAECGPQVSEIGL